MTPLEQWARTLDGRFVDLDGSPAAQPYQCHDVWLSYLLMLGGRLYDGHAPGDGYANQVWRHFPKHRPRLADRFTLHMTGAVRAGDVVFWDAYQGGLPHVAVALADQAGGRVLCLTQNPGATRREALDLTTGFAGVLRPIHDPTEEPMTEAEMKKLAQMTADRVLDSVIDQQGSKEGSRTTVRSLFAWMNHQWAAIKDKIGA